MYLNIFTIPAGMRMDIGLQGMFFTTNTNAQKGLLLIMGITLFNVLTEKP